VTSLLRELKYQAYMLETYLAHYQSALTEKKIFLFKSALAGQTVVDEPQEDGSVQQTTPQALKNEADETRKDAKMRRVCADRLMKSIRCFELTAINTFWVGVLLLAVFAGINVVLGAEHHYLK
jgi:hypothetical protein